MFKKRCIDCDGFGDPYLLEKKEILDILFQTNKLPLELCEKILSYYKPYSICSICKNSLCYKHGELAHNPIKRYYFRFLFYYKKYKYLCEDCSFQAWDIQYG